MTLFAQPAMRADRYFAGSIISRIVYKGKHLWSTSNSRFGTESRLQPGLPVQIRRT